MITGLLIHATFATFYHPEVERSRPGSRGSTLALDARCDVCGTAQSLVFVRGIKEITEGGSGALSELKGDKLGLKGT